MQKPILARITPFIFLGIAIVAFVFGLMLLAYLFIFGAFVGLILFMVNWVREKFFPSRNMTTNTSKRPGRTFDQDEFK